MFTVLLLLIISTCVGFCLRGFDRLRSVIDRTTPLTVFLLLFIFGISIGANDSILGNLHRDGLKAGTIALFGVAGSVLATLCFKMFDRKGGRK